jgi:hypothetical protein
MAAAHASYVIGLMLWGFFAYALSNTTACGGPLNDATTDGKSGSLNPASVCPIVPAPMKFSWGILFIVQLLVPRLKHRGN